jgi:hypothetical protein
MDFLNGVLTLLAGLVGFPAALAAVINLLKYFGLSDGSAPAANMIGHLIAYVGVALLVLTGRIDILPGIDVHLSAVADLLLAVLAFFSSMKVARSFHRSVLTGFPLVGYSYGLEEYRAYMEAMEARLEDDSDSEDNPEAAEY